MGGKHATAPPRIADDLAQRTRAAHEVLQDLRAVGREQQKFIRDARSELEQFIRTGVRELIATIVVAEADELKKEMRGCRADVIAAFDKLVSRLTGVPNQRILCEVTTTATTGAELARRLLESAGVDTGVVLLEENRGHRSR